MLSYVLGLMNEAIDCYIHFCHSVNLDPEQISTSMPKYILLHQKFINVKHVYDELFPGEYINWAMIRMNSNNTIQYTKGSGVLHLHKFTHWLHILSAFTIDAKSIKLDSDTSPHIPASSKKSTQDFQLMADVLKRKDISNEQILMKIILLKHILYETQHIQNNHSPSSFIIEQLFTKYDIEDAMNKSLFFAANMNDVHLSTDDHEQHVKYLLSLCKIHESECQRVVTAALAAKRAVKDLVVSVRQQHSLSRPRLQDKLKKIQSEQIQNASAGCSQQPLDSGDKTINASESFDQWCHNVRFPNTFSYGMKCQIYFIMSQCNIENPPSIIPYFIRCRFPTTELRKNIISQPNIEILYKTIHACVFTGYPFVELINFRRDCLSALRQSVIDVMTWNNVFHLYVCVYQQPTLWKDLWKRFLSHMNVEIVKYVQIFVDTYPFRYEHVVRIFMKQNGVPMETAFEMSAFPTPRSDRLYAATDTVAAVAEPDTLSESISLLEVEPSVPDTA
jgi:hypothetical protein